MHNLAGIEWSTDIPPSEWDSMLAKYGGHPLQSELWGQARCVVDGIESKRMVAFFEGFPIWMARIENRNLPMGRKIAWIPRGPVHFTHKLTQEAHRQALGMLKKLNYLVCISNPYPTGLHCIPPDYIVGEDSITSLLDLTAGRDVVYNNMHKKLRYGVRAAERAGVQLEESTEDKDIDQFFVLCDRVSRSKSFTLPGSNQLMKELIRRSSSDSAYKARLFVSRFEGEVASGYLSIENGNSLHNMWNGTDRHRSKQCPGEAALWFQVDWGIQNGLVTYDLEGIDEENNPGCYRFKTRLGGVHTSLPGIWANGLHPLGVPILKIGKWMKKF